MGYHVVLIIEDITARIGDPSGRSTDRPALTNEDIAGSLATYQRQQLPTTPSARSCPYLTSSWCPTCGRGTEWTNAEISLVVARVEGTTLHPMDLKRILASEAVAALYDVRTAMEARRVCTAQFSRRSFSDVESSPTVDASTDRAETLGAVLSRPLEFIPSVSAARRVARQNGLRVIIESERGQSTVILQEEAIGSPLHEVVAEAMTNSDQSADHAGICLKAGRKVARLRGF